MEYLNRISYFLLGLGVGTAVGMLFAPKAGAETRDYLRAKGEEAADILRREGQDLRDRAVETIDRGKQNVRDQVKNLSDAVDAGKQAFHETLDQARTTVTA
jgi:gas vesicle protein